MILLIDWFSYQIQNEVTLAEQELSLCNYMSTFLKTRQGAASGYDRSPRAAPLAMMALASVGLFESRIVFGTGECGLRGIFVSRTRKTKQQK